MGHREAAAYGVCGPPPPVEPADGDELLQFRIIRGAGARRAGACGAARHVCACMRRRASRRRRCVPERPGAAGPHQAQQLGGAGQSKRRGGPVACGPVVYAYTGPGSAHQAPPSVSGPGPDRRYSLCSLYGMCGPGRAGSRKGAAPRGGPGPRGRRRRSRRWTWRSPPARRLRMRVCITCMCMHVHVHARACACTCMYAYRHGGRLHLVTCGGRTSLTLLTPPRPSHPQTEMVTSPYTSAAGVPALVTGPSQPLSATRASRPLLARAHGPCTALTPRAPPPGQARARPPLPARAGQGTSPAPRQGRSPLPSSVHASTPAPPCPALPYPALSLCACAHAWAGHADASSAHA
jgi:hypothetical protein